MINNCLNGKNLPVYGDGMQIRDWLYVEDHCAAIATVLEKGVTGEVYNIGGNNEKANIDIVKLIIGSTGKSEDLIVPREGPARPRQALRHRQYQDNHPAGWAPKYTFETGMASTIDWYLRHGEWMEKIVSGEYMNYYEKMYSNNRYKHLRGKVKTSLPESAPGGWF